MQRYKLFVAIFLIFSYALAGYVFVSNRGSSADRNLENKLSEASTKVDEYVASKQKLPDSNPPGIDKSVIYTRYSDNIYMLCATFAKSRKPIYTGYSLNNLESGQQQQLSAAVSYLKIKDPNTNYVGTGDSLDLYSRQIKQGKNCFVLYSPFTGDNNSPSANTQGSNKQESSITPKCNEYGYNYTVKTDGTIDSINKNDKTITFSSSTSAATGTSTTTKTLKYDSSSLFYDSKCTKINIDGLKKGTKATLYSFFAQDGYADQVEI